MAGPGTGIDPNLYQFPQLPTVPLEDAMSLLKQPDQPPADPSAFSEAVQGAHVQANMPTLVNSFLDTLGKHQQQQQMQLAEEQANSDQQFADSLPQPVQQQQDQVNAVPASSAAPAVPAAQAQTASQATGLQKDAAGLNLGALAGQDPSAAASMVDPAMADALQRGDLSAAQQDASQVTPEQASALQQIQPYADAKQQYEAEVRQAQFEAQQAEQARQQAEQRANSSKWALLNVLKKGGDIGAEVKNALTPENPMTLLHPEQALKDAGNRVLAAKDALVNTTEVIPGLINAIPTGNVGFEDGHPTYEQNGTVGSFVGQMPAYAQIPIKFAEGMIGFAPLQKLSEAMGIPAAIWDAAFAGDAAQQSIPIIHAYQQGEISGKDAVKQIAMTVAPQAGGMALGHAGDILGAAGKIARGSEIARGEVPVAGSEPTGVLASEAGRLRLAPPPVELNPGERIMYHGSAGPIEGALNANTFLTSDPETAAAYARTDARVRGLPESAARVHAFVVPEEGLHPAEGVHIPALDGSEIMRLNEGAPARPAPLGPAVNPVAARTLTPYDVAAGERGAITPGKPRGPKPMPEQQVDLNPEAPAEPPAGTAGTDPTVFQRMPVEQLQKMADNGVGGAKAELARREEVGATGPAAAAPEVAAAAPAVEEPNPEELALYQKQQDAYAAYQKLKNKNGPRGAALWKKFEDAQQALTDWQRAHPRPDTRTTERRREDIVSAWKQGYGPKTAEDVAKMPPEYQQWWNEMQAEKAAATPAATGAQPAGWEPGDPPAETLTPKEWDTINELRGRGFQLEINKRGDVYEVTPEGGKYSVEAGRIPTMLKNGPQADYFTEEDNPYTAGSQPGKPMRSSDEIGKDILSLEDTVAATAKKLNSIKSGRYASEQRSALQETLDGQQFRLEELRAEHDKAVEAEAEAAKPQQEPAEQGNLFEPAAATATAPNTATSKPTRYGRNWTPEQGDIVLHQVTGQTFVVSGMTPDGRVELTDIRNSNLTRTALPKELHIRAASSYDTPSEQSSFEPNEDDIARGRLVEDTISTDLRPTTSAQAEKFRRALDGVELTNIGAIAKRANELAQEDPKAPTSKVTVKHLRTAINEIQNGVPAETSKQLESTVTQLESHGQDEEAKAVDAVLNPANDVQSAEIAMGDTSDAPPGPVAQEAAREGDTSDTTGTAAAQGASSNASGTASNAGAAGTSGTGGGSTGTTGTTGSKSTVPSPATTSRMNFFSKLFRHVQRQAGVEIGDPPIIRDTVTDANRDLAAALIEARQLGEKFSQRLKGLGQWVIDPNAMTDAARRVLAANPDAAPALAISNPFMFDLTPEQTQFVKDFNTVTERVKRAAKRAGVKITTQTDDTNYFPRFTIDSEGRPVVTTAGSFTHGRSAGPLDEALDSGNVTYALDPGLALQAHLESVALTRRNLQIREALKGKTDKDGVILYHGAPNSRHGFSPVNGMDLSPDKFGRVWQARDGRAHELLTDTYSNGLGDLRALTAPSRFSRSLEFSMGLFHATFGNLALMGGDLNSFIHTLPDEWKAMTEGGRSDLAQKNYSWRILHTLTGGQLSDIDRFGSARRVVRQAQGMPEAEPMIPEKVKVPGIETPQRTGIGQVSQAGHTLLFEGVMPNVQISLFRSAFRKLASLHPELIPQDFEQVMQSGDKPAIEEMLARNPEFKQQLEGVSAHATHAMGFTESTLGRGEKAVAQGLLNTPTITRAIAANMRDLFMPPGNIQGALARRWWVNVAGESAIVATGLTIAANGGVENAIKRGYLKPGNPKFILNPNNGKYFMSVGLPSGTTVTLMPSPMRTPLRILTTPLASAAEAVRQEPTTPGAIAKGVGSIGLDTLGNVGNSLRSRVGADIPLADAAIGAVAGGTKGVKQAIPTAEKYAEGAMPLFLQNSLKTPPQNFEDLRTQAGQAGGMFVGADIRQATARENLNNYLLSQKNPDGSARFPQGLLSKNTTGLQTFLVQDPEAARRYGEYINNRIDNGGAQSAAVASAIKGRSDALTAAAETFKQQSQANANDPHAGQQYRTAVSNIRGQYAQQEAAALTSLPNVTDPEKMLINSWYDLYKQASGADGTLHTDDFTDPVTGAAMPGLDSLQAQWQQQHPGAYQQIIEPNDLASVSQVLPDGSPNPEYQLRQDRQSLADSGWWQTQARSWAATQQAAKASGIDLSKYANEGEYSAAVLTNLTQQVQDYYRQQGRAITPTGAQALAQTLIGKDRVIQYFGKYRTYLRLALIQKQPTLLDTLVRWGYGTPTRQEVAVYLGQQQ